MVARRRKPLFQHRADIEILLPGFPVKQDNVVLPGKTGPGAAAGFIGPDDLVDEVFLAEDFIRQNPQPGMGPIIHVHKQRAFVLQKLMRGLQHPFHGGEILGRVPAILKRRHVHRAGHILPVRFAHPHAHAEGLAREKRRIQINALHLALVFFHDFRKQRQGVSQIVFPSRARAHGLLHGNRHASQRHPNTSGSQYPLL